jgi:hypothetical protein
VSQLYPVAQSENVAHDVRHEVAPHLYAPHDAVVAGVHPPLPSQ